MKKIIVSAFGLDKPGIVSKFSKIITENFGNIEHSKMTLLEDHFAMLILISYNKKDELQLYESLNNINQLQIKIVKVNTSSKNQKSNYKIYLNGADNEGIVHKLTHFLALKNINIYDVTTKTSNAPITGIVLFEMEAEINIPDTIDFNLIKKEIKVIASRLDVDISIKKV